VGAWAPPDDGAGMDLDSVTDMAGEVDGRSDALGGGSGSRDGKAGGDKVGVSVDVADRADCGTGGAAAEGVASVVQRQKEAVMNDGGAHGGGVQGNADGAVGDDAASREMMACDASGGDLRETGFQTWKARKAALKNQRWALARARKHP
jgi:hypothetical protein